MSLYSPAVQRLLEHLHIDSEQVVVLSFSADWVLQGASGALSRLGLDQLDEQQLSQTFKDVCVGLSRLRGTHLPQLELPAGGVADLHLLAEASVFHAVLIDVRESVELARSAQQTLQELKLEVMARTREVVEARQRLGQSRQRLTELQGQLLVQQQADVAVRAQLAALQVELERELEQVSVRLSGESAALLPARRALAAAARLGPLLTQLQAAPTLLQEAALQQRERVDLDQLVAGCVDGATQLARERGLGFELRLNRRSTEVPLFNTALLRQICSCTLNQALLRCPSGRIQAQLRWEGGVLKLLVTAPGTGFSEAERAALWDAAIADPADPVQGALLALGALLRKVTGRATSETLPEGEHCLTVSVAQAARDGEITERLVSGGRVWLLIENAAQLALAQQRLHELGLDVEVRGADKVLELALRYAPDAILIDSALDDAVRLAFQLKGRGYRGRVLALGMPADSPVARASFDSVVGSALEPDALLRAIRGPGG